MIRDNEKAFSLSRHCEGQGSCLFRKMRLSVSRSRVLTQPAADCGWSISWWIWISRIRGLP